MSKGRRRFAALVFASLFGLAACEQVEQAVERARGTPAAPGPAPLEQVPLDARALAGSVLPQDQVAALLAPEPVLIAPGQILVGARSGAETAEAAAAARDILSRLGVSAQVEARGANLLVVKLQARSNEALEWNEADRCPIIVTQRQLESDIALATRCALQRLRSSRRFAFVEPNHIARASLGERPGQSATKAPPPEAGGAPNDPLYAWQWHFRSRGEGEGQSPGGAGFQAYWQARHIGDRNVRVAVLDSGLDFTHPDFRTSANVASGVDLISDPVRAGDGDGADADPQDAGDGCDTADDSFHGTRVASLIGAAASNDRAGIAGGAWNVTVAPVRVLGRCGGELADIVSGIRWAAGLWPATVADGRQIANAGPADIINLALTIQAPCPVSLQAAINEAVARNVIVVAAAGNRANRAALFAPANCDNVLVAAASDARGELAFYSNFGPEVDVLAPGGDMFADADNDGRPDGVLAARATQSGCFDPLGQNTAQRCFYAYSQGASLAAAHVSAALALMAAQTGLRGRALEQALMTRALAPLRPDFGRIECARSRNAAPVSAGSALCDRPAGRGALDLSRAIDRL